MLIGGISDIALENVVVHVVAASDMMVAAVHDLKAVTQIEPHRLEVLAVNIESETARLGVNDSQMVEQ